MSSRTDLLLWAQRVLAMTESPAHVLLEIKIDASIPEAQDAFHKIARTSHPDLHRSGLSPDELETVTLAYSRVAGAYQDFRSQRMQTSRMRPIQNTPPSAIPGVTPPVGSPRSMTPAATPRSPAGSVGSPRSMTPAATARIPAGSPRLMTPGSTARLPGGGVPSAAQVTSGAGGSGAMNSKALIYYRKAELALRRGDLKGALLQMKMAIAGDPQSALLRSALVEIEAELAKKP